MNNDTSALPAAASGLPAGRTFDAIVVGAGPAGAVAARELGAAGLDTLLIEKQRMPRPKVCGGGLTYKVVEALPFDVSPVVERTVTTMHLSWRLSRPATLASDNPLVYMVRRSRFDAFLVEQARATGHVELLEGDAVRDVAVTDTGVDVHTAHGTWRARYLVGADGATGVVARSLGLLRGRTLLPAVECEVACDAETLAWWQDRMGIDIGTMPGSYGWVFPKEDHLNVGVGCFAGAADATRLNRYADAHRRALVDGAARVTRQVGYVLPLRPPGAPIQRGRALLVGDAAGLVEGFSGEGIYWAIRSARLAARAIVAHARAARRELAYQHAIDAELMPELLAARRLTTLYVTWPRAFYALPKHWPTAWRAICRIVRGERTFEHMHRLLRPFVSLAEMLPGRA